MTREQFLLDTIKYYSENPSFRCVTIAQCAYSPKTLGKDGDGCAIGRWLNEDLKLELDTLENTSVLSESVFQRLPEWMQSLGKSFLNSVQELHDADDNWDNGLSDMGKTKVNLIIETYNLNIPKYK